MHVQILNHTTRAGALAAAGVCRNADDYGKALSAALKAGHDSLLEHWVATFQITGISRSCSHQLVRHRIGFSFAQQSQRHVQVAKGDGWYVTPPTAGPEFHTAMEVARQQYEAMIKKGMPLEDARYLLPNATKTNLIVTANARALSHFFHLRCCSRAQWEIMTLSSRMLSLCRGVALELFVGPFPDCERCKEKCDA